MFEYLPGFFSSSEVGKCFNALSLEPDCRVIVLSANGKHFTAGIDLLDMLQLGQALGEIEDVYRRGQYLEKSIKLYQDSVTSIEACAKPVITCVHSACVGAGVDIITAADMRFCTKDAWFTVKEVDIGMPPDVGTLQRLPRVIGNQTLVRELCYTGRKLASDEALSSGLVGRVFETKEQLLEYAVNLAEEIAKRSPVAVQAIKKNLNYSQEHSVQEGLDQVKEINKLLLQGEDFLNAVIAAQSKGEVPVFSKL